MTSLPFRNVLKPAYFTVPMQSSYIRILKGRQKKAHKQILISGLPYVSYLE